MVQNQTKQIRKKILYGYRLKFENMNSKRCKRLLGVRFYNPKQL